MKGTIMQKEKEVRTIKCKRCGHDMVPFYHVKWSPRVSDFVITIVIVLMFFTVYGKLSNVHGSENVAPIFVGISPLVFGPLIMMLKRNRIVRGWKCPNCDNFVEDDG